MHGLKSETSKSKEKAVSGFSLGSGGAHFAPKKDKAKKEPRELTLEQLEKKSLGMLKKHYTPAAKEAAAVGAQKLHDSEAAKTTPPKNGPYEARPASAFGSRTQMTWGTNPKAATPSPFRHSDAPLGSRAPIDRIDSRSMVDDPRQRANMQPRPVPLESHLDPRAAQFEEVSAWNDRNRTAARSLAESHGDRVPAGGWPKITGQDAARDKQSIRAVDKVLLSHDLQLTLREDKKWGLLAHYRAPEPGQKTAEGVGHTGRGAVYDKNGLLHLLSHDRPEDVFIAQTTKYKEMLAKKAQKKSEGENQ